LRFARCRRSLGLSRRRDGGTRRAGAPPTPSTATATLPFGSAGRTGCALASGRALASLPAGHGWPLRSALRTLAGTARRAVTRAARRPLAGAARRTITGTARRTIAGLRRWTAARPLPRARAGSRPARAFSAGAATPIALAGGRGRAREHPPLPHVGHRAP